MLQHKSLIKVLLDYGADVNKSYQCSECELNHARRYSYHSHGALQCATNNRSKADAEIIQILLDAGSFVNLQTVSTLLELGQDDIACQIASKNLLIGRGLVHQPRSAMKHFTHGILVDKVDTRLIIELTEN